MRRAAQLWPSRLTFSNHDDIKRLFAESKAAYGKVNVLVNNAGIYEFAPLESISAEHFHKHFNLNVLGLLLTTQEAVKLIGPTGGSIINMSSIAGKMPVQNTSVYSATKAAVDAITIALSQELRSGLHAGGLAESDFRKILESQTPLGRIAQPEDVARAAVFFASDDAGWVTGQSLILSGGQRQ